MRKKNQYTDMYKVKKEPKYRSITVVYLVRLKDGLMSRKKEVFKNIKSSDLKLKNGLTLFKIAEALVRKREGNRVEYLNIEDVYFSGSYDKKR